MTFPILMTALNTVLLGIFLCIIATMKEKDTSYIGVSIMFLAMFCANAFATLQLLGWIVVK